LIETFLVLFTGGRGILLPELVFISILELFCVNQIDWENLNDTHLAKELYWGAIDRPRSCCHSQSWNLECSCGKRKI
jgi:hypothetical protein